MVTQFLRTWGNINFLLIFLMDKSNGDIFMEKLKRLLVLFGWKKKPISCWGGGTKYRVVKKRPNCKADKMQYCSIESNTKCAAAHDTINSSSVLLRTFSKGVLWSHKGPDHSKTVPLSCSSFFLDHRLLLIWQYLFISPFNALGRLCAIVAFPSYLHLSFWVVF